MPPHGTYRDWKHQLAVEAQHQCVYCAISEASFGGIRNFHVEHFRPTSRFGNLENAFHNLFYACAICNSFKGSDWKEPSGNPAHDCYLDPSAVDYAQVFEVGAAFEVGSNTVAGRYMTERLFLNRPQLMLERRFYAARGRIAQINTEASAFRQNLDDHNQDQLRAYIKLLELLKDAQTLLDAAREAVPYSDADVRR